jgi:serine/threonine-protein kinase RsbT
MPHLVKSFPIKARDFIGFDPDLIRRVSICAFEAEMNVVMHGGNGTLAITVNTKGISLDVNDDGPGIEDIELALKEGYSTASQEAREMGFGAGMGLPNIKKNSDSLEILSEKGKGTVVKISFDVRIEGV